MTTLTPDEIVQLRELAGSDGIVDRVTRGCNGEYYLQVSETEFGPLVTAFAARKCVLIGLFCAEGFSLAARFTLFYVFERHSTILILVRNSGKLATSVASLLPSASWFERECRDGFGIEFEGAFDERRLFLHETYPEGFHPLKKEFRNGPIETRAAVKLEEEYPFRRVEGEGVYQVAVGPVHAGIIEPGHFRFSVIGEKIFNLEIRMFYKHRGIEKLAEGRTPREVLPIAEVVSGDESVANATAYCCAVEKIVGSAVPDRAWYIRTILLELERIQSHLGDQSGMLVDVAFPLGASQFSVLREEVLRINAHLTGSRFLRGIVTIGGLSRDIGNDRLDALKPFLMLFKKRYRVGLTIVLSTTSVLDRFSPTGVIKKNLLRPLNITGPVARASGGRMDVRVDHPYGLYDRYAPSARTLHDGDVLSRFTIKASEILDSVELIERLLADMPAGEIAAPPAIRDGHALALVESARGQNVCWVWIRNGVIERYKVRTASFCTWQAIEHAVQGEIVPDFPLINKSLNLSYAGTDL